jgi:hypothetical protein
VRSLQLFTWTPGFAKKGSIGSSFGSRVCVFASGFMVSAPGENGGRVRLYDADGNELKIYKDNLAAEGEKSNNFGQGLAVHNGAFIMGIPNKVWGDRGAVQFGIVD